jgi:hypothetical protein
LFAKLLFHEIGQRVVNWSKMRIAIQSKFFRAFQIVQPLFNHFHVAQVPQRHIALVAEQTANKMVGVAMIHSKFASTGGWLLANCAAAVLLAAFRRIASA